MIIKKIIEGIKSFIVESISIKKSYKNNIIMNYYCCTGYNIKSIGTLEFEESGCYLTQEEARESLMRKINNENRD